MGKTLITLTSALIICFASTAQAGNETFKKGTGIHATGAHYFAKNLYLRLINAGADAQFIKKQSRESVIYQDTKGAYYAADNTVTKPRVIPKSEATKWLTSKAKGDSQP